MCRHFFWKIPSRGCLARRHGVAWPGRHRAALLVRRCTVRGCRCRGKRGGGVCGTVYREGVQRHPSCSLVGCRQQRGLRAGSVRPERHNRHEKDYNIWCGTKKIKAGNLEMRVSWIAFGMKWAEIRSGTFCLEQGPELSRHDTLRDGGARNISLEPEPEPEPKPKKGKNVIRRRSGSRLKCNRLTIRFESNLVRISQCSIPPAQPTPPPGQPAPGTGVAWPPCRPVKSD